MQFHAARALERLYVDVLAVDAHLDPVRDHDDAPCREQRQRVLDRVGRVAVADLARGVDAGGPQRGDRLALDTARARVVVVVDH